MRLNLVHIVADRVDDGADRIGRQLGAIALRQQQLCAVKIEAWRAPFVRFDMGFFVADDSPMRLNHGCQGKTVGCRPRSYPQNRTWLAEQVGKSLVESIAQTIPVIRRIGCVRCLQGIPDGRVNRGGIIG